MGNVWADSVGCCVGFNLGFMRELKFRFWHNVATNNSKSKYFYDADCVIECLKQQINFNEGKEFSYDHIGEGCVFEQYTGLKDGNGNEIYEGDILQGDNSVVYKVFFGKGAFMASTEKFFIDDDGVECKEKFPNPFYLCDFELSSINIIGNINENFDFLV